MYDKTMDYMTNPYPQIVGAIGVFFVIAATVLLLGIALFVVIRRSRP